MWWHILTQAGNVTICPTYAQLHLAVTRFSPWLKGVCQRDFLCRTTKRILKGSWEEMAAEPLFIIQGSSGTLPRQQSISAAIHHRPECCWEGGSQTFWPCASEALMKALVLLSDENFSNIKLGQLSCHSQSAIKTWGSLFELNSLRNSQCVSQDFKYIPPVHLEVGTLHLIVTCSTRFYLNIKEFVLFVSL